MAASLALTVLGIALIPTPALLGLDGGARIAALVAGPVLAALGIVSVADVVRPVRRAAVPVGLALAVSPLVLAPSAPAAAVALVGGLAAAALGLAPLGQTGRFGGGWSVLLRGAPVADEPATPRHADKEESAMTTTTERDRAHDGTGPTNGGNGHAPAAEPRDADTGNATPQVVVVTGASAGVGRAIAHAFARRGDAIGLIARDERALGDVEREVEALGGRALVLPLDVADANAVEQAAARVEETLGPIDVWVNNAMVSVFSPVKEMTAAEYRRVTDVTYLGYVHGTLAVLHRMLSRDSGVILQIGSALAYRAIPLQSAYCAAKHAIQGFTESLRSELMHDGSNVRVTMIQLPAVNTPQFDWVRSRLPGRPQPVPPIFQPEVIADGVVWASEHDRRELNIGFSTDMAIYGNRVIPGLLDRYLARTGYESQQTDELEDPDRPDNLYEPVHGLHRTRGRFDAQAKTSSSQLWLATNRALAAGAAAAVVAAGVAGARALAGARR